MSKLYPMLQNSFVIASMFAALYYLLSQVGGRMFWPILLSTYLLGTFVYLYEIYYRKDGSIKKGLFNYFFSRKIWLHPSAKHDYLIILINLTALTTFFHTLIIETSFFELLTRAIISLTPVIKEIKNPDIQINPLIIGAYTLLSFLLSDMFYYLSHRLQHKIPWLWEFHKVHHSAKVMTPATLHRAHLVDVWISINFRIIGLGIAAGIFYYFYPNIGSIKTIMGVNAVLILSYFIGANLRHSHIWLPYGAIIEHVFMSPAQHQIHHSEKIKHYDKNFGSALSLWDWMFNSLYVLRGKETLTFGLSSRKEEQDLDSIWKLYFIPFKKATNILMKKFKKQPKTQKKT